MKSFAVFLIAGAVSAYSEVESAFIAYIGQFSKNYNDMTEFKFRLEQFKRNYNLINQHNATESSYKLGYNRMSDWTEDEYLSIQNNQAKEFTPSSVQPNEEVNLAGVAGPINWVTLGSVNPIQDQGMCGAGWAFAAVAAMESYHKKVSGKLLKFSEQQLIDCNTSPTQLGCSGGVAESAFLYFYNQAKYAMLLSAYPYVEMQTSCKYNAGNTTGVYVISYPVLSQANITTDTMKNALADNPLVVSINAACIEFQQYKSGIFTYAGCASTYASTTQLVNIVGWNTEGGMDYWLVRNSWGTGWGESGYIRIQITPPNGLLGITTDVVYPTTN